MNKNETWKDRAGNRWKILVVESDGPYPILAKCLNQDVKGQHLFTSSGGYSMDGAPSPFDLVERVESHAAETRRERDELFDLTCAALQGLVMLHGEAAADRAVTLAIQTHKEFVSRVENQL